MDNIEAYEEDSLVHIPPGMLGFKERTNVYLTTDADISKMILDYIISGNRLGKSTLFRFLLPHILTLRVTAVNFSFQIVAKHCPNLTEYRPSVYLL